MRRSVSFRELAATSYLQGRMDLIIAIAMANLCKLGLLMLAPINHMPHYHPPPPGGWVGPGGELMFLVNQMPHPGDELPPLSQGGDGWGWVGI